MDLHTFRLLVARGRVADSDFLVAHLDSLRVALIIDSDGGTLRTSGILETLKAARVDYQSDYRILLRRWPRGGLRAPGGAPAISDNRFDNRLGGRTLRSRGILDDHKHTGLTGTDPVKFQNLDPGFLRFQNLATGFWGAHMGPSWDSHGAHMALA